VPFSPVEKTAVKGNKRQPIFHVRKHLELQRCGGLREPDLDQLVNLFAQRDDLREVHVAIEFEKLFKSLAAAPPACFVPQVARLFTAVGSFRFFCAWQPDSIESAPTVAYQPSTNLGNSSIFLPNREAVRYTRASPTDRGVRSPQLGADEGATEFRHFAQLWRYLQAEGPG
jgi:hypothetical protein